MIDERFFMHRLKSTSLAAVTGSVTMGGYTLYQLYFQGTFRKDLMIFLGVMAATKIVSMLWLRYRN